MSVRSLVADAGSLGRLLLARFGGPRFPLSVTYICTTRCTFRCRYCDVFSAEEEEMTTPQVRAMIDQFAAAGMRRFSINGGEPLLRSDIGEIVAHAKNKGLYVTLFTNGSLAARGIDALRRLDVLLISLDGPAAIHDAQRHAGAFKAALAAIEAARREKIRVWVNTVITRQNVGAYGFILDLARAHGVECIVQPVMRYSHSAGDSAIDALAPAREDYERLIDMLIAKKLSGGPIAHSVEYLRHIRTPDWRINPRRCWAGKLYCSVTPSGTVAPCYPIFRAQPWPSGPDRGFARAFRSLGGFSCTGCYCLLAEQDYLCDLRPGAVSTVFAGLSRRRGS